MVVTPTKVSNTYKCNPFHSTHLATPPHQRGTLYYPKRPTPTFPSHPNNPFIHSVPPHITPPHDARHSTTQPSHNAGDSITYDQPPSQAHPPISPVQAFPNTCYCTHKHFDNIRFLSYNILLPRLKNTDHKNFSLKVPMQIAYGIYTTTRPRYTTLSSTRHYTRRRHTASGYPPSTRTKSRNGREADWEHFHRIINERSTAASSIYHHAISKTSQEP